MVQLVSEVDLVNQPLAMTTRFTQAVLHTDRDTTLESLGQSTTDPTSDGVSTRERAEVPEAAPHRNQGVEEGAVPTREDDRPLDDSEPAE